MEIFRTIAGNGVRLSAAFHKFNGVFQARAYSGGGAGGEAGPRRGDSPSTLLRPSALRLRLEEAVSLSNGGKTRRAGAF